MATVKQIAANRRNAIQSSGPKTSEGKQRSALNALRHGLCSEQVLLEYEHSEHYHKLLHDLLQGWSPTTPQERLLVEQITQAAWRMQRAMRVESGTFNLMLRCLCDKAEVEEPPHGDEGIAILFMQDKIGLDRLRRYMTAAERAYERLIDQLLKLRAASKLGSFRTGVSPVEATVPPSPPCVLPADVYSTSMQSP